MLKILARISLLIATLAVLPSCATSPRPTFKTWQEEVKLNDGRIIVVQQKRRCQAAYTGGNFASCIGREAWLTVRLPEFGNQDIVWNEKLSPMLISFHNGNLYLVAQFPTELEFRLYGKPQPPYIGFRWQASQWHRIAFAEIPEAIYDGNLLIDIPSSPETFISLARKAARDMNGDPGYSQWSKRVDPNHRW